MKETPSKIADDTLSRRQFSQLMLMVIALFGATGAAPGLDRAVITKPRKNKQARYFEPGEADDRDDADVSTWRLEWFGDGVVRMEADNTSWWPKRLAADPEWSKRERAFMEVWLHENDFGRSRGINSGHGLAQDLMLSTHRYENPPDFEPWLTNRERKILSTFVQWLGTNCGQSFLYEVRRKGGIVL